MDELDGPWGSLSLARYPERADDQLRAFDAADEMLLAYLVEAKVDLAGTIVILNDTWGALATALAAHHPIVVSDSYLARRGLVANLERNGIDPGAVELLGPIDPLPDRIDALLVRPPKTIDLLEHFLRQARPGLHTDSIVVGAAMTRHVHRSGLDLFERLIGPTRTSRAVRKARLIHAAVDSDLDPGPSPWPQTTAIGPTGETVIEYAGVFSAGHLDLGCGNGLIGLGLARRDPSARVTFLDESILAVASAQATFLETFGEGRNARFGVSDGLFDLASGPAIELDSVDLVVVNPPFHRDHSVGDATAWQMFSEAERALRPGGELRVVGNRHLGYHAKLKRLFGNSTVAGSDSRFVVLTAIKH